MGRRRLLGVLGTVLFCLVSVVAHAEESGYAPVDINDLPQVDGKLLMIASYIIVLAGLMFYAAFLVKRERIVAKGLKELENAVSVAKGTSKDNA